ncbi:MAG: RsmE family RNA methyltransferase [Armatimonadota bacterium]|nr:RsmE family RNA methyltransferase [Armatimonadota bacterium]
MKNHRRFFVEGSCIDGEIANITGDLVTQIRRVLRLNTGDWIKLLDGCGTEYEAQIVSCSDDCVQAKIASSRQCDTEPTFKLTVAMSLAKADKIEMVAQKCTELGMSELAVFLSERSVPRLNESKLANRLARWRRIASEAAEQSGRGLIPEIQGLLQFRELISTVPQYGLPLLAWEGRDAQPLRNVLGKHSEVDSAIVIVGPEGGFTPGEVAQAVEAGAIAVSLGKTTLRCETAAIAACAILMYEYGDTA